MTPESQPPKNGRPSSYDEGLADRICARLMQGDSMQSICAADSMPSETTVYRWLNSGEHAGFREKYAGAREAQAHRMLDKILEIAADDSRDVVKVGEGKEAYERERFTATARDKLHIDTLKWAMGKLAPKVYGTKLLDVTSDGQRLTGIQINDIGAA